MMSIPQYPQVSLMKSPDQSVMLGSANFLGNISLNSGFLVNNNNGVSIHQLGHPQQSVMQHTPVYLQPTLVLDVPVGSDAVGSASLSSCSSTVTPIVGITAAPPLALPPGFAVSAELSDPKEIWSDHVKLSEIAKDPKNHRMLKQYFPFRNTAQRKALYLTVLKDSVFFDLTKHPYGNLFIQKLVSESTELERDSIMNLMSGHTVEISYDEFGSRVVQKLFSCGEKKIRDVLLREIGKDLCGLAMNKWGRSVLIRIINSEEFTEHLFIMKCLMASKDTLKEVILNRNGCHTVQYIFKKFEDEVRKGSSELAEAILDKFADAILVNCDNFTGHQYANFIIQGILKSEVLHLKRNIIVRSLLQNLLSLSQEKYASHVVETALKVAPPRLLRAMFEEIFDGYQADEKGRDALDVLIFDQFGNYVVQTMLVVSVEVKQGKKQGNVEWFDRLATRIVKYFHRLKNYSSGKKLIQLVVQACAFDENDIIEGVPIRALMSIPEQFR